VIEKGAVKKRILPIPDVLTSCLALFIKQHPQKTGPLFLSKRKTRISSSTIQQWFRNMTGELNINKQIHPHLFRHTAATWLNKTAGTSITQFVLGHARRSNTYRYAHLNPDVYAIYMQRHPFMNITYGDATCNNLSSASNDC
jgi:integrase/recombinase XerC